MAVSQVGWVSFSNLRQKKENVLGGGGVWCWLICVHIVLMRYCSSHAFDNVMTLILAG